MPSPGLRLGGAGCGRMLAWSLVAMALLPAARGLEEPEWDVVNVEGHEFVTAESVRKFYEFDRLVREGNGLLFRKGSTMMRWAVGAPSIYINNVKFVLSIPVMEQSEQVLVSRVDLQKLLDPVLRPWFIEKAAPFDTVIIDAGHGGHDSGARSSRKPEKEYALDLALKLQVEVEKLGFKTRMIRKEDIFVSLPARVKLANEIENAVFVSLHFNHGSRDGSSGIETFALAPQGMPSDDGAVSAMRFQGNQRDAENIALATAVHAMAIVKTNAFDRGIKRARYNVLRGIDRPAILFEAGFLSNAGEILKIDTEEYRVLLAQSIAAGIQNYSLAVGGEP